MTAMLASAAARADEPEALEPEFFDYLLKYESHQDNWTVAADEQTREQVRALREQRAAEQRKQPQQEDEQ